MCCTKMSVLSCAFWQSSVLKPRSSGTIIRITLRDASGYKQKRKRISMKDARREEELYELAAEETKFFSHFLENKEFVLNSAFIDKEN